MTEQEAKDNLGNYIKDAAFPQKIETSEKIFHTKGLTKREYFAAMRNVDSISLEEAKIIMGKEPPPFNTIEYFNYCREAIEKLAVLRADALIKALNEIQP